MRGNRDIPVVVYTRPKSWSTGKYTTDKMKLRYCAIGGEEPKLRKGQPAFDNVGIAATKEGCEQLVDLFRRAQPEIYFHWTTYGKYDQVLMKLLKDISPNTLWVFGQGNQVLYAKKIDKWIWDNRRYVDVVLTNTRDPHRYSLLKKWGAKAVYPFYTFGFDPEILQAPKKKPEFDCFFGGGDTVKSGAKSKGKFPASRFRHDFLHKVSKRFKTLIRGGGWQIPHKPGVYGKPYFDEMQRAKIILGTYHFDLVRYYTKRTVFGGASGRLFMTRYIPKMEKDFTNHKNIVWFRKLEEGLELIDHYLKHDDEREKIAKQTREWFCEHHTWEARLREFENIVYQMRGLY